MTQNERAEMCLTYLKEEGYVPKLDDDGDITFKSEGRTYLIIFDDDDMYFRLLFPNFWEIECAAESLKVERAALHATEKTKVAKVFLVKDDVWATVELFCSPPEVFKNVFARSMSALRGSIENFAEKMRE